MDEHHGEATKTSILWKKLNSVHPGHLASIHRAPGIPVEPDRRETIHLPQGSEACGLICSRTGRVPGISAVLMLRVDDGVEVSLVRNHLR